MHTMVHDQMSTFFRGFRRDAHPMAVMCGVVGALSAFYHDSTDINDPRQREIASHRLIAKMPTIAAMAYKYTIGQPFVYPLNNLGYTENFLRMTFSVPAEEYKVNPCSPGRWTRSSSCTPITSRTRRPRRCAWRARRAPIRLPASRPASPACGARRMAGANEAALKMLEEIGSVDRIPEFIKRAKDPNDDFRLMGFGHRVYKNYDPRARALQKQTHAVLEEVGHGDDPILKVAMELERIALQDDYFVSKKLYPNIDFYSGITLKAMGFPTSMFTRAVRARPHRRLDRAMGRDDRGPGPEDRPPAADLHRRETARLRAAGEAVGRNASSFEARYARTSG